MADKDQISATPTRMFVDMGWGDWRVADEPQTCVTPEQVAAVSALASVESVGASEVRFGQRPGELCVFHSDGQVTEVGADGSCEHFAS